MSEEYTVLSIVRRRVNIKRLAGRNWRFISLRGSEAPGFAFGSPASRRCAAGAARRTRFHPASPSAHLPAAAARRAPLAELAFTGFAFGSPASRRCAAGAARRTRFSISNFREYCTLLYYFLWIFFKYRISIFFVPHF